MTDYELICSLNDIGTFTSGVENGQPTALVTVFENGKLFNELTFDQVRANSNK